MCLKSFYRNAPRTRSHSQRTRARPPPSAPLRFAATSPLRGGGLLLPQRGALGSRCVFDRGALAERSDAYFTSRRDSNFCHSSNNVSKRSLSSWCSRLSGATWSARLA